MAEVIIKLEQQKQRAILDEKYEYAKRLKLAISDLHKIGETLGKCLYSPKNLNLHL